MFITLFNKSASLNTFILQVHAMQVIFKSVTKNDCVYKEELYGGAE